MLYAALLRNSLEAIFNPFSLILILLGVTLILCFLYQTTYAWIYSAAALLICICAFSTGWLPTWLFENLARQYTVITTPNPAIRWIVVLGGGHHYYRNMPVNQMLINNTVNRLLEGVRIYQQIPGSKLILSGGGYHVSTQHLGLLRQNRLENTDGFEMAELASWFHIPKTDIVVETASINTADQAVAIKALVHAEPFYLVTSAIHMPRSMALFHRQGLHPIAAPAEYSLRDKKNRWIKQLRPDPANLVKMNFLCHEYLGLLWMRVWL